MSDLTQEPGLTERLAAKLMPETEFTGETDWLLLYRVTDWLPLLLSEPELVAGLAPEVKREVLRTLLGERLGDADLRADLVALNRDPQETDERFLAWLVRVISAPSPAPSEAR